MRKPSILCDVLVWHRQAIAGMKPPITHEPQVGWFKRRLVKGGPWVACRIWLHQDIDSETGELIGDETLRCEVGGKERDAVEEWVWLCANPITEAQYDYLNADAAWLKKHAPQSPEANPTQPTRTRAIPTLF